MESSSVVNDHHFVFHLLADLKANLPFSVQPGELRSNIARSSICTIVYEAKSLWIKTGIDECPKMFLNAVYLSEFEITLIKSIFTYFPVIYGSGWINTV